MQILKGTKREITLYQWNEKLQKAKKRLSDSRKCNQIFGGNDDWVLKDENRVNEIEKQIVEVIKYMDDNNIK